MHLSCKILFADVRKRNAQLAQLVEQRTENPRVSGSIPELGIFYCLNSVLKQVAYTFKYLLCDVLWPIIIIVIYYHLCYNHFYEKREFI